MWLGLLLLGIVRSDECPGTKKNKFFSDVHPIRLVDPEHRLVVISSPKAGATIATQLMFDYLGLTETVKAYDPWIHNYRDDVFDKDPTRQKYLADKNLTCAACASGWTCIHIVRNPLTRSVSSYIHVMRTELKDKMIGFPGDASFRQYIKYLMKFRTNDKLKPQDGDHANPQYYVCGGNASGGSILYVPVEFLYDALGPVGQMTGHYLGKKTFNSAHYIHHKTDPGHPPVHDVPFSQLKNPQFPPYEDFLQDPALKRMILGCLFDDDVRLYQRVCGQPWLLDLCPTCSQGCISELATMRLPAR